MPKRPPALQIGLVPFDEAIAASAKRKIVLPDVYYGKMQGIERAEAFSVAGIAALDQLQHILDSVTTVISTGADFRQWKDQILKSDAALALPKHRLENIFRTNIQGAYARGRCIHIEQNKHVRPYLVYSAINDSRVRPAHLAMNGHVALVGDAVWKRWMPPCGYMCRCTVISLTREQAEKLLSRDKTRLNANADAAAARATAIASGPDDGWGYSPCERMGTEVIEAAKARADRYHAALAAKISQIESAATIIADSADPNTWAKVEARKGSNDGGVYQAADGSRYYVKFYADVDQARTEVAAHNVNALFGLNTPETSIVSIGGRKALASRWQSGAESLSAEAMLTGADRRKELARIYASAALTKNWDVVGAAIDNIVSVGGRLTVIDTGGSFMFRAQGARKLFAAGPVDELESLLNSGKAPQAAQVFGKLTEKERRAAIRAMDSITKSSIDRAVAVAGFDAETHKSVVDTLWARRKWMLASLRAESATGAVRVFAGQAPTADQAKAILTAAFGDSARAAGRRVKDIGAPEDRVPFLAGVDIYTGYSYQRINKALRSARQDKKIAAAAAVITEGIRGLPKYSGAVRRGLRFDISDPDRAAFVSAHREALSRNAPIEYRGFLSTSTSHGFEGSVRVFIDATGLQGAEVSKYSQHAGENEVLFPSGSRFSVVRVVDKPGVVEIYLRETMEAATAADSKVMKAALPANA